MPDEHQWAEVATATSNTTTNSNVDVFVSMDGPPLCSNMTDAQFRKAVLELRDEAVVLTRQRIVELSRWTTDAQARVADWFGSSDATIRDKLIAGLSALVNVMSALTAKNFVRRGTAEDRATGCVPGMKNLTGEVAHVCRPDTATHTIALAPDFCTLPERSAASLSSKQLTIVHECSHFI